MLRGKAIDLRLVQEKDLDLLFVFLQDFARRGEHFPLFLLSEPLFKKEFYDTGFWSDDFRRMLVCNKDQQVIGSIFSWKVNNYSNTHEVAGMVFDASSMGLGLAGEAMRLFVDHLFRAYPVVRVQGTHTLQNHASARIAEKAGMRFEGIARQALFLNGRNEDLKVCAITRDDWVEQYAHHGMSHGRARESHGEQL